MNSDSDGAINEHKEYLKSIGDGIIEGVGEGMRSGVIKGSRRGVVAGLRDCLAKGLINIGEGDFEDVAGYIAVGGIVGDVEVASSAGHLAAVSDGIIRQIRGRVLHADKTRRAVAHIKARIKGDLPNNPLSNAIAAKTQKALDDSLDRSIEEGPRDARLEKGTGRANEIISKNVKSAVEEIVAYIVYRIVRQTTKRVTADLKKDLKEESIRRLEETLGKTAEKLEQGLDKGLDEGIKRLTDEVFKESADEMSFVTDIDGSFGGSFKGYLSSLFKGPRFPFGRALLVSAGVIAVGSLIYVLALPGGNEPPMARASVEWIEELTVDFSSVGSYDPDGYIEDYHWDFGDGFLSAEPDPEHTYTKAGNYTAILIVTDNEGATAGDATYVDVDYGEPLPDLVITEVWLESGGIDENIVYYRIENQGEAEAGPSFTFLYFGTEPIDERKVCDESVGPLVPGQSESMVFDDHVLADDEVSELLVCADADDWVEESDEGNNCTHYE